jgi:SUR7/PalI family
MDYCDGYYEPNTTVTKQEHPSENVTHCSNRTALFHFDPTAIIESELAPGINLTDIHWPSEIEDATKSVELASKVMFIFYCIGIGFAGLAVIGAVWGVLANGRISASVNFTLDMVSSLASKVVEGMTRRAQPTLLKLGVREIILQPCTLSVFSVC